MIALLIEGRMNGKRFEGERETVELRLFLQKISTVTAFIVTESDYPWLGSEKSAVCSALLLILNLGMNRLEYRRSYV